MGMFGSGKRFDPSQGGISMRDRAMIGLMALNGDYGGAMQMKHQLQSAPAQADAMQQLQGLMRPATQAYTGVAGPTTDGSEPSAGVVPQQQRAPMRRDLRDPEVQRAIMNAQRVGVDPAIALKLFEANGPNIQSNGQFTYDARDARNAGRFFPSFDKGQAPLMGPAGEIAGVRNLPGATESAAAMTAAVEGAKAKAQAPYQFPTFEGPDGAKNTVSAATAAALGARGGLISRGQSPADAAASKLRSEAQAGAQVDLPRNMDTANATLGLIEQLRNHPGRALGTGATGVLPPIPGTDQKDFVKLLDQAKGKAFLEAFATLKGGGQITEVEGRKATDAIARLDRTQSEAGFLKALDDLEAIVRTGASRAQHQAGAPAKAAPTAGYSRDAIAAELRRRGLLK